MTIRSITQQRNRPFWSSNQQKRAMSSIIVVCLLSLVLSSLPQAVQAQEEQPANNSHTIFLPLAVGGGSAITADVDIDDLADDFVSPNEDEAAWAESIRLTELVEPRLTLSGEGIFDLVPPLSEAEIGNSAILYADILAIIEGVNAKLVNKELTPADLTDVDGKFILASFTSVLVEDDSTDDEEGAIQAASNVAVPAGVGDYGWANTKCLESGVIAAILAGVALFIPGVGWIAAIPGAGFGAISASCALGVDKLKSMYISAYRSAPPANPGYPINDVHTWKTVVIQDFRGGSWGDGAIIKRSQKGSKPEYVGGSVWTAYKRAANDYGVFPGYPYGTVHDWGNVRIQDFRQGSWGEGAIIVTADKNGSGFLIAGNHWKAYKDFGGNLRLGHPVSFINYKFDGWGWWNIQRFEGGEIWEQNGMVKVLSYKTWKWLYFHY